MDPFITITGVAVPLLRADIDTDVIIPSREIKTVGKSGLAAGLFAGWRYRDIDRREPDPEFILNKAPYRDARILLGGANFGCGSSREHAVWALREYGFRAILAPSFAPIFSSNCVRNGVLPAVLASASAASLSSEVQDPARNVLTVDLRRCVVTGHSAGPYPFKIDAESRTMLLEGLDPIGIALKRSASMDDFIMRDRRERPWVYL